MSLTAFLSEFSSSISDGDAKNKQKKRNEDIEGSLLDRYPWLQKYQDDKEARSGASDSESDASIPELEEDAAAAAFSSLEAKRYEVDTSMSSDGCDFRVTIRGGAWTARHLGVPFDSVRGAAFGPEPIRFCKRYRLPQSGTFAYRLYSDRVAECLARFWCQRLQALYDTYLFAREEQYRFSQDDLAAALVSSDELDAALAGLPDSHPGWARRAAIVALAPRSE